MNLLRLRESENNRIVSENSIKLSKRSIYLRVTAIIIAVISALTPLFYDWWYETNELKTLKSINQSVSEGLTQEQIQQFPDNTLLNVVRIGFDNIYHTLDSLSLVLPPATKKKKEIKYEK